MHVQLLPPYYNTKSPVAVSDKERWDIWLNREMEKHLATSKQPTKKEEKKDQTNNNNVQW